MPFFMWGGGSSELHRDMGTGAAVGAAGGIGSGEDEEDIQQGRQEAPPEDPWWSGSEDVFEDPY